MITVSFVSPFSSSLDTPLRLEHVALRFKLKHFNTDFHHLQQKIAPVTCHPVPTKQIYLEFVGPDLRSTKQY